MAVKLVRVKSRFASLRSMGLAVQSFPRYVNRDPAPHAVDAVLMSFIVQGRGHHVIDDERFAERGRSLAVTHLGQRHDIVTTRAGMHVINVYLDFSKHVLPRLPDELGHVLPMLLPLHPRLVHRQNRVVRVLFDDPQPAASHLQAIERELSSRDPGRHEAAMLHWKLFLMLCCRQVLRTGLSAPDPSVHAAEEIRRHLDETFADKHTLGSLARRAGMGRTSLCRAFKAHTGKSIMDYLIDRRIQSAMLRLRCSSEKVIAIAMACGFNDMAYFNRKFKQLIGQTPLQYRGWAGE